MKILCEKKALQEVLSVVSQAVSPKSTNPCLEGVLLSCGEQTLTVTGYNIELGMVKSIPITDGEEGQIVLNAPLFLSIVSKMSNGVIQIAVDDRLKTTVSCGDAIFTIMGLDPADYPALPEVPTLPECSAGQQVSLEPALLANMIAGTLFAVAQNDQTPVYLGSLCSLCDGVFTMVSLDGYRLALRRESIDIEGSPDSLSFIVPGKTLAELQKLLHKWGKANPDSETTVTLSLSPKHITFSFMGYAVISRLIEGDFIDYEQIIPSESNMKTAILVSTADFSERLGRVSILINERMKSPLVCHIREDILSLTCETPIGKAEDGCPIVLHGEELSIRFNNRYMQDAIRAADCNQVRIQFQDALSPIKILPSDPEDHSFLFLVLPVRS